MKSGAMAAFRAAAELPDRDDDELTLQLEKGAREMNEPEASEETCKRVLDTLGIKVEPHEPCCFACHRRPLAMIPYLFRGERVRLCCVTAWAVNHQCPHQLELATNDTAER